MFDTTNSGKGAETVGAYNMIRIPFSKSIRITV